MAFAEFREVVPKIPRRNRRGEQAGVLPRLIVFGAYAIEGRRLFPYSRTEATLDYLRLYLYTEKEHPLTIPRCCPVSSI